MGKNPRSWERENGPRAFFAFVAMTSFFLTGSTAAAADEPIQEIVITATKTKNDRKLIPQSVDVLTQKDFAKWGAQTVEDVLKRVPNLDLTPTSMQGQSSQVTHQVSLRGMGNKGTLILVDGRRLAGEDAPETINGYELRRINLHDVDRIEVLRGAASALYGSDAVGGVIQIFMKKPEGASSYAGVTTGSSETSLYGGLNTDKLGKLSLGMSYDLTKVRKDESEGWTNMFGPRRHFSFEGTYEMTDEDSVRFGASFMRESLRQSVQSRGTTWYDNNRQDYHLAYEGTHGKNEYDLKVYHNRLGKHSYLGAGTGYNFDRAEYATSAVEGRVTYRADESHTFTYGTEYRHLEAGGTRYGGSRTDRFQSEGGLTKGYSKRGTDQYAFYGADEWKIGKKLLFVPSIRWDHHEDFGSEWSPRAGLTYLMDDHNRFKVNYGFAYRAPSPFERYGDMEETPVPYMTVIVYGNEDLRPEKTRTFDAGYEGEWGKAKGRVTYFYNQARDLIVSKVIGRIPGRGHMTLINSYANVDRATIQGIEGDFHYDFDDHYGIRAAYTYMDGRDDETHEPLSGMARATGLMEVSYTDGKKAPFTVSLAARWNDRYRIESARTGLASLYSYSTMDLSLSKQLGRMMVFAGIDNLFDKTFDTESSFAIPGRVWKVGAEWKF